VTVPHEIPPRFSEPTVAAWHERYPVYPVYVLYTKEMLDDREDIQLLAFSTRELAQECIDLGEEQYGAMAWIIEPQIGMPLLRDLREVRDHDPLDCAFQMVGSCGFCGARCSHEHTEECQQEWLQTYGREDD